jgi:uncharacterized protein YegJ (DUF2314 family)
MTIRIWIVLVCMFAMTVFGVVAQEPPAKTEAQKDAKKENQPLRSLVFLRASKLEMTEKTVVAALQKTFPKRKINTEENADITVAATELATICTLEKEKITLLINSFPKPYVEDTQKMAKEVERITGDKELAAAMSSHKAWFSVDILGGEVNEQNSESQYELLSRVIASFHDSDTTLLFFPEKDKLYAANAATLKLLRRGKGLDLTKDAVINIEKEDADLKEAVEKARKQWGDFTKAYAANTGENHSVKFKFVDKKNNSEFMWVEVTSIEDGLVYGKLANVPNYLTNIKEGDVVKRPASEIEDWLYIDNKKMIGGFSIEVLQNRQKKRSPEK